MKFQNKYQTNADCHCSYEKLLQSPLITNLNKSEKGHINFRFKGAGGFAQLTAHGTLLILWDNREKKQRLYSLLPEVLATSDNSQLTIKPVDSTPYSIPFGTRFFELVWCSKKTIYITPYALLRRCLEGLLLGVGFMFFCVILWGFGFWLSMFLSFILVAMYAEVISGKVWFRKLDKNLEQLFTSFIEFSFS